MAIDNLKSIQGRLSRSKITFSRGEIREKVSELKGLSIDNVDEYILHLNDEDRNELTDVIIQEVNKGKNEVQPLQLAQPVPLPETEEIKSSQVTSLVISHFSDEEKTEMVVSAAQKMGSTLTNVEALQIAQDIPNNVNSRIELLDNIFTRLETFAQQEQDYISRRASAVKEKLRVSDSITQASLEELNTSLIQSNGMLAATQKKMTSELDEVSTKFFR